MKLSKLVMAILAIAFSLPTFAQLELNSCVTTSRNPWEWPGHNNWFIGTFSGASNVTGWMIDFQAGFTMTTTGTAAIDKGTPVYEGVTTASNDLGELVVFSNGRWAWDNTSTRTSTGLKEGNEGGSNIVGSSAQGIMAVRHPLTPKKFYLITVGDVIGGANPPVSYNIFDENGVETTPATSLGVNAAEGIAATFHENEVDIWVSVLEYSSSTLYSWLLTCDGFVDPPVTSNVSFAQTGDGGRGGVAFSPDGTKFATAFPNGWPNADRQIVTYDFDRATGKFSNANPIAPTNVVIGPYDVMFSKDGSRVIVTGGNAGGVHSVAVGGGGYRKETSTFGLPLHHACEVGPDGNYYFNGKDGLWRWSGSGSFTKVHNSTGQGLPTQYIPPAEEPNIEEVGPFCDTSAAVDLYTEWICNGLSAEDTVNGKPLGQQRHLYSGTGITDDKLGIFDPAVAGVGRHEIIFTFCDVDDTIWIDVIKCPACKAELQDVSPKFCAGNDLRLDTMIVEATGTRTWSIEEVLPGGGTEATLNITGSDTIFDATNIAIKTGTYKLKLEGTYDTETCYDTMYVTVDSLPLPDLGADVTICADADPVEFDAGAYDAFAWLPDGETTQTIEKSVANTYSVTVTDANGCEGTDDVDLIINDLPIAVLPNDTFICDGDPAIDFSAASSTGGGGSAITSFTWNDGASGDTKTTDVAGEYWVAIEDANSCTDTDTVVLVVNALPVVDLRTDTSICEGDAPITFEALNPDANDSIYVWNTGETGPSIAKDTAGTYKVVLTDKNGCLDSTEVTLSINALPVVELNDSTICDGAPAVVFDAATASPGMTTYRWNGSDVADGIFSTDVAGGYEIIVIDANQCSDTDSVTLFVNSFIPVDLGPDLAICADDDSVTFNSGVSGGLSYTWAKDDITNVVGTGESLKAIDGGTYLVALLDANGCPGGDTVDLTVNPLPVVDLGNDTAICIGDPAVVFDAGNAGVGMSYTWSNTETTQTISTADAGEYTVAIEDVNGCTDSDTVVLVVNALPVVDLGPDQEICQAEDSVTFDAGHPTALSWVWDHGPTTQTIKAHFDPGASAADQTYTVTVTDTNNCVNDTFVVLTVNPMPTVDVRDTAVCVGDPDVTFDVGAVFDTYAWKDGGSDQTQTYSDAGIYHVTFTTASGCAGVDSFELVRNPLPTPDLGLDQTICADDAAVTFTPGVYDAYSWSDGSSAADLSTKVDGTYTVEVTDANGCKASDDVVLTVIPMPTPAILVDATKCPGSSFTFDVTAFDDGFGPFTYAWHDGSTASTFNTTAAVSAWVDITNVHGCTGRDAGSVVDKSDLTVVINDGAPIDLCEGEDIDLIPNYKAADGYNFAWSNALTSTSETVNASVSGLYELHVDNGGGCEGDGSILVTVHPNPVVTPTPAAVCDGAAATIGDDQGSGFNYSWSHSAETGATVNVLTAGTFTQTLENKTTGCIGSGDFDVTIHSNPVPELGPNVTVCEGVPVTLENTGAGTGLTYSWSTGSTDPTINPTTSGTYTLTVTTPESCTGSDNVDVTFIGIPVVEIGPDITLCEGESATVNAGNETLSVSWNSGQNTSSISVNATFEHIVTVSNGTCDAKDTMNVFVVPMPVSEIDQTLGDQLYCFEDMTRGIDVIAGSDPAYSYLWNTANADTTPEITVTAPGTYLVRISAGSCEITDYIEINEFCPSHFYAPNAFTPDADGINDYFSPKGHNLSDYTLLVYNRWGELIFESNNIDIGWDGTFMGNEAQIDVYVWKAFYSVNHPDGNPRKEQAVGRVSLLR